MQTPRRTLDLYDMGYAAFAQGLPFDRSKPIEWRRGWLYALANWS